MGWAAHAVDGWDGRVADNGRSRFGLAVPGDEPELRRLLRDNPMGGEVVVSLEREPDFFAAAAVEGPRHQVVVERRPDGRGLAAMGCRSVRQRYVDGRPRWVPYLGSLRVDRPGRGRLLGFKRGFEILGAQRRADETPWALTSIVADNLPARRLLTSGVPGMPRYTEVGEIVTLVLPTRRHRTAIEGVEAGSPPAQPEILACLERNHRRRQFAPAWSEENLNSPTAARGLSASDFLVLQRRGNILGCLAVWDQRPFKQTVVRGYGARLGCLRPLLNLAAPWLGTPRLPAAGSPLEQAFLSHLAVDRDCGDGLLPLVAAALGRARQRGCDSVALGLARGDPLLPALQAEFRHRAYRSVLCLVSWDDGGVDLPATAGRVFYPEVAVL